MESTQIKLSVWFGHVKKDGSGKVSKESKMEGRIRRGKLEGIRLQKDHQVEQMMAPNGLTVDVQLGQVSEKH